MDIADSSSGYILLRSGEEPDPSRGQSFSKAAAAFLKGIADDPRLNLHDTLTQVTYTAADADLVRTVYFSRLAPQDLQVRSADNRVLRPVENVPATVRELAQTKSGGLYVPADDLWIVKPPEQNPRFEEQMDMLQREAPELQPSHESPSAASPVAGPENYPVETHDDLDLLPGLSGERILNSTMEFLKNSNPATLLVLGSLAGVLAYKSMGLKGLVGLLLAIAALKRYLKMGNRIIQDQRLDLVARGLQDGIPVDKQGRIDPEFLEALRHYPVGNHHAAMRRINPAIKARPWEHNKINIDPASHQLESYGETISQVADGDTIMGTKGRYRLIGIDTPEIDHKSPGRAQAGAYKAWERVRELIPPGSAVRVEVARNQPMLYGRMPCYLYARDQSGKEICINELLVKEGLARVTNFQPYHPKIQEFITSALEAISQKRGLWNAVYDPKPQPSLFSLEAQKARTADGNERISLALS